MMNSTQNQEIAEGLRGFLRRIPVSYFGSTIFLQQMTRVALGQITNLRDIIPQESYILETFCGVDVKIISARDRTGEFLNNVLTVLGQEISQSYIQKFALAFYVGHIGKEEIIELHVFEYSDNNDRVASENVREKIVTLMETYDALFDNYPNRIPFPCGVKVCLNYNGNQPVEHSPVGLYSISASFRFIDLIKDLIEVGTVETKFHKMTFLFWHKGLNNQAMAPVYKYNLTRELYNCGFRYTDQIICPCDKTDFEENGMLICQYCKTQQHAVCFGILHVTSNIQHCCTTCYDRDTKRVPTDSWLALLKGYYRQDHAIFRRVLHFCSSMPLLSVTQFMKKFYMTQSNLDIMIDRLQRNKILYNNYTWRPKFYKVNTINLSNLMTYYFYENIFDQCRPLRRLSRNKVN